MTRLAGTPRVHPEAYEACLKGYFHWYKLTRADLESALRYFESALDKDPGCAQAYAGIAGVFIALIATLAPSEIWTWIGVVFAVVIIGRLGNPIGALGGGILIGVCEAMTMAVTDPAWAPLVSFSLLIALLLLRPRWV